ncbi:hypothetical protein [Glycomyces tarimensis]
MRTPVLAVETVVGRRLRFAVLVGQPRLRATFLYRDPPVLGSVIGLDGDRPQLRVSTPIHMEWAATHAKAIVDFATRTWTAIERDRDH